ERGRACSDAGDALAVLPRRLGQAIGNVALEIGGDALHPADRDRLLVHAAPAAGRFARTVAHATQDAREDIRPPVDFPGIRIPPGRNKAQIFRNRSMSRAGPLTVNDLVEMVRQTLLRSTQFRTSPLLAHHALWETSQN